jgi:isoquinoline 1-oxidoreductase alpha subunit
MIQLSINGREMSVDVDPATPLLWVLRDALGLTGTKFGCGIGVCGACTVHVDGQPGRSCSLPVGTLASKQITTIEAMEADRIGKAVQDAWVRHDVVQCGYCQSGQVMAAAALLKTKKNPGDRDIDEAMAGNICRCGTYVRIRAAVKDAARSIA